MDPRIVHIVRAARKGGKVLKRYFGESLETTAKSTLADLQTKADTESESEILAVLRSEFPDYGYFSEETGRADSESPYTFVIDPLDGTSNFVTGLPTFVVSIALLHRGIPIIGVVYCPYLEGAYYAQRGMGAYFDGAQLSVNKVESIDRATVAISAGYHTGKEFENSCRHELNKLGPKRVLQEWATAYYLCLLASGRIEGIISNGAELYDFAAGKLIAEEAGAIVTDFEGNQEHGQENNTFVISNTKEIHGDLLGVTGELLKKS